MESGGGQDIHRNGGPEAVLDEEGTVLVHQWAVLRVDRDGIFDGGVVHAGHFDVEFRIALHTVGEAPVWEARGDRIGPRVRHILEGLGVIKWGGDGEADVKLTFGKRLPGFIPRRQVVGLEGLNIGMPCPEPHGIDAVFQRPDFRQIHIGVTR